MPHSPVPASNLKLNSKQARTLIETAKRLTGVAIAADKIPFIELRVSRRLREIGCADFDSYIELLQGPKGPDEARCVAESLTTHTTSFFRERDHFDWLQTTGLPSLLENGAGRYHKLTVWSAACSIGPELWTAAIVLDRFVKAQRTALSWEVVGTDVSRRILKRAAAAIYTTDEVSGLPEELRRNYLMRSRKHKDLYRIVPELRSQAKIAWANLVELDRNFSLMADVAFLRNVLIYFQAEDQNRAIVNVVSRLRSGGYLLTGHSESLGELPGNLRQIATSTYQKV